MADNTTLNTGSGGDVISTDDIAGVKVQRVKPQFGADGSATDVSSANPMPVVQTGALPAGANAIGKLAANSGVDIGDVDVTSSALPTGAATSAKQPALGTAGSASADVISVQGIASMTPVKVDGSGVTQPVSGTVTASGPLTDTQLRASAVPVSGTVTASGPLTDTQLRASAVPISVATIPSHAVTNAGTFPVQDSQKVADDAAFTVGTTPLQPVGFLADETATDSVDEGDVGASRITLDRKLIVTVQPHTAGGWLTKNCTSGDGSTALTNTAQAIKASAGKLGGWFIYNPNSSAAYVPIYNVASGSVTVGTTNPLMVLCIPATSAANLELVNGITFDTAISASAVTTGGGATAPTTALEANFFYL